MSEKQYKSGPERTPSIAQRPIRFSEATRLRSADDESRVSSRKIFREAQERKRTAS